MILVTLHRPFTGPSWACALTHGPQEFLHRCATGPGRPAVLHGVPEQDHWPALGKWQNQASFLQHYGHLHVQVTEMAALHGLGKPMRVELSLEEYAVYARDNQVDWPFYVWERNFTGDRHGLLEDFATPKVMGEDLYDLSPEVQNDRIRGRCRGERDGCSR
ncbi:unnamed protein product [Durusdinium trenchii]|uniref:Uncharacterized protein n=1 Tax=Durusdinium trenchii TaxID=1381693 RepID=A0ABP0ITY9_9DINO